MTTYKFCVAPGGTLVCYKENNGFIKFTGNYAQQLLEHIKDFSFYAFKPRVKKVNEKYTYDMTFESNNHKVIFEDVNKLRKKESFSIEKEIKELVNIVKENNIQIEREEKKQNLLKRIKSFVYAATISTTMVATANANVNTVSAETTDDQTMANNPAVSVDATLTAGIPTTVASINNLNYNGQMLTKSMGILHNGPSGGDESFYDLNMSRVVQTMRDRGFDEINFPYWVRADGVKMLGNFVMVAANLEVHPRGSVVQTSLGMGLVCDTGGFAKTNKLKLDIATSWVKGN